MNGTKNMEKIADRITDAYRIVNEAYVVADHLACEHAVADLDTHAIIADATDRLGVISDELTALAHGLRARANA